MADYPVVTMHDKDFEIKPPDGLIMLRVLKVVADVGQRAEAQAKQLGVLIFNRVAQQVEGQEQGGLFNDETVRSVFLFLSVLEEDDLLRLGSALLQFPDEAYGMRWLRKHGVKLTPLVHALMHNLEQVDDLVEAIRVFTPTLSGMMAAAGVRQSPAQDGSASVTGSDS